MAIVVHHSPALGGVGAGLGAVAGLKAASEGRAREAEDQEFKRRMQEAALEHERRTHELRARDQELQADRIRAGRMERSIKLARGLTEAARGRSPEELAALQDMPEDRQLYVLERWRSEAEQVKATEVQALIDRALGTQEAPGWLEPEQAHLLRSGVETRTIAPDEAVQHLQKARAEFMKTEAVRRQRAHAAHDVERRFAEATQEGRLTERQGLAVSLLISRLSWDESLSAGEAMKEAARLLDPKAYAAELEAALDAKEAETRARELGALLPAQAAPRSMPPATAPGAPAGAAPPVPVQGAPPAAKPEPEAGSTSSTDAVKATPVEFSRMGPVKRRTVIGELQAVLAEAGGDDEKLTAGIDEVLERRGVIPDAQLEAALAASLSGKGEAEVSESGAPGASTFMPRALRDPGGAARDSAIGRLIFGDRGTP